MEVRDKSRGRKEKHEWVKRRTGKPRCDLFSKNNSEKQSLDKLCWHFCLSSAVIKNASTPDQSESSFQQRQHATEQAVIDK